jgi:glycosyltransferase involved in cell wall biosynthesis
MLDTIVHDETGRLVAPSKPNEVAAALNMLLGDTFLRQSMGAAGRDRVQARYSWDRVTSDMMRIYDRVAEVRAPQVSASNVQSG